MTPDQVVEAIQNAESEEEALKIEAEHLAATNNGLRPGDPEQS